MKITRRKLRKLINETVKITLKESAYKKMLDIAGHTPEKGTSGGFLKVDDQNKEAAILHHGNSAYGNSKDVPGTYQLGKNIMQSIAKATKKDLTRKNYYIWTGLDSFWNSKMTELEGVLGRSGDPYLYQGVGSKNKDGYYDKLQVVAGPSAKQMGFIFSNKKKIEFGQTYADILGGLASSSLASSKSSSTKSSNSSNSSF